MAGKIDKSRFPKIKKKKDPLAGGSGGRSSSSEDMAKLYSAARGTTGGKGGRSISDQALSYLYNIARGVGGQGMKPKKKKSSLPKAHPQKGKYKHGGRVRRKTK